MGHAGVEFVEVFEQPDAGNAVHGRQVKSHLRHLAVVEFEQFVLHVAVVEVGVGPGVAAVFECLAGFFVELVVFAEVVGVEYLVHHFAAVAAEEFVVDVQALIGALLVAVETGVLRNRRVFGPGEDTGRHMERADFVRPKVSAGASVRTK